MRKLKIIGVDIFLEKRTTRLHVGVLKQKEGKFIFTYDDYYFKAKHVIPLGPEFPLTKKTFSSKNLFPSFVDRIPSSKNPAYPEYCHSMGIDPKENDSLILLSSIGRRGPSSFIFFPSFERNIYPKDLIEFRKFLGMTSREFATVFEFSQTSLNAFERNRIPGSEIIKRLEIIINFPKIALYYLVINGGAMVHEKWIKAKNSLESIVE